MLTKTQFQRIFPNNREPDMWFPHFSKLTEYGIISPTQVAAFCAQIGHESADLTRLNENLNYSAEGLRKVFSKYFRTPADAASYARKPRMIANRVYGGRMGNGPESSGDGWKYRGRGILQLTGKNNYRACSLYLFNDEKVLLDNPDLLVTNYSTSLLSAIWFWVSNNIHKMTDIEQISRRVNGGTHGMEDRKARYQRALRVLSSA